MGKISWTYSVGNEEVLHRVKKERNILHAIKRKKANWIGHILCKNCLLIQIIEEKVEGGIVVMGRQGRKRMQLLEDLKEVTGSWSLKEEAYIALRVELALENAMNLS